MESATWDLSGLYTGFDDPAYERDIEQALPAARAFRERYAGMLGALEAAALADAVAELERIVGLIYRVGWFPRLQNDAEASEEFSAAFQRVLEWGTAVESELLFFDLEWNALDDADVDALLASPMLERYRHVLASKRRFRPYQLSEAEERVAAEKASTGIETWVRLYLELLSQLRVQLPGGEVSVAEANSLLETLPDRDERRETSRALTTALEADLRTRAFVLNAALHDRAVDDRLRGYPTWISAFNLSQQISDSAVEALIESVAGRYDIAQRHFRLRAGLLGLDRLATYDLYAQTTEAAPTSWDDAREIVLDAYGSFSSEAREIVGRFFDERRIDAAIRPGKMPAAYSTFAIADAPSYVLLSYTGGRRSVLTLAHELGHGLHGHLAQSQGYLNTRSVPLTMAETASVFGESLTYDLLRAREDDPRVQLDLLVSQIDMFIKFGFVATAANRFEDAVHTARRSEGELPVARVNELWVEQLRPLFGDAVEEPEEMATRWSHFPHFVGWPGYMYPYAFGVLLSFSLYRRWVEEGDAFVESILNFLRAGSSSSPDELVRRLGFDLTDPEFWNHGLDAVEALVAEAEALADSAG